MSVPFGNENSAKGKEWTAALRRAMAHRGEGDYRNTLLKIAKSVVERAEEGDVPSWREIADREDGKPTVTADVHVSGTLTTLLEEMRVVDSPGSHSPVD